MRLLVACPACQRQYDASQRPIGSQFRCACGHVVVVQKPDGHDAQVVHCSSCGAARSDESGRCAYCGAEFTLRERDLDTVCPHCLARVSDGARFCHHCGIGLVPELVAGANTKLLCPACQDGHILASRRLGTEQVTVLECGRCAGFWMGREAFRELVERSRKEALPVGTVPDTPQHEASKFAMPAGSVVAEHPKQGSFYRSCVVCGKLTNRLNYGHASGVIIDVCRDHGIWFDADELARILAWLRAGGNEAATPKVDPMVMQAAEQLRYREPESHPVQNFVGGLLGFLFGLPD
jgi:Zn-finger nucleic acid-binding protein